MECDGTTYVGTLEDDLGEIRYVFCDACRTIAVDSWDARRKRRSWGNTHLDPENGLDAPFHAAGRATPPQRFSVLLT